MKTLTTLIVVAAMILSSPNSHARGKRLSVGKKERLHELCDVSVCGPHGERLALSFNTTTARLASLGVYCKDDGYVLSLKSAPQTYFNWPDSTQARQFQFAGLLPAPLPSYKVPTSEYLWGFSFWFALIVAAGCLTIKNGLVHARVTAARGTVEHRIERRTALIPVQGRG